MHFTALTSGEHFFLHFLSLSRRIWNRCERRQDIADILWGFFALMRVFTLHRKSLSERRTTLFGWEKSCVCGWEISFEVFKFFKLFFFSNLKNFVYISLSLGWLYNCVWMRCLLLLIFTFSHTNTHKRALSATELIYIRFSWRFYIPNSKKKEKWEEFRMDRNSVFSSARRLLSDSTWHFCDARTPYG